jgi:hypothetical protein
LAGKAEAGGEGAGEGEDAVSRKVIMLATLSFGDDYRLYALDSTGGMWEWTRETLTHTGGWLETEAPWDDTPVEKKKVKPAK